MTAKDELLALIKQLDEDDADDVLAYTRWLLDEQTNPRDRSIQTPTEPLEAAIHQVLRQVENGWQDRS